MRKIWEWFVELNNARGDNKPLTYSEIFAWSMLTQNAVSPSELVIIKRLDIIAVSLTRKSQNDS